METQDVIDTCTSISLALRIPGSVNTSYSRAAYDLRQNLSQSKEPVSGEAALSSLHSISSIHYLHQLG